MSGYEKSYGTTTRLPQTVSMTHPGGPKNPTAKLKSSQASRCPPTTPAARKRASTASELSRLPQSSKRIRKPSLKVIESQQPPPPALQLPFSTQQSQHKEAMAESDSDALDEDEDKDENKEDEFKDANDSMPPLLQYMSVWRIVIGKDTLPGVKSGVYEEGAISMR
ncbi:hypothetical protein K469DRAFT_744182 [Zopfia rhizophila CBS 207.26]|uniref:Uncharacterized protein n=1 Tax=Zopfia rhizophila CBS 207.26 TaxID=1314779 RepID=A0A6A6EXC1_9PEZI|nr:hypothetical protein K469DRAFT_744182 [Zopfia rhizophila CBS 207.26]